QAALVHHLNGEGQLPHQGDRLLGWPGTIGVDQARQGSAVDERHDDEVNAAVLADIMDRADVRMVDGGGKARLSVEPIENRLPVRFAEVRHLEGDRAAQLGVFGKVDCTHPTLTQLLEDGVAAKLLRQFLLHGHGSLTSPDVRQGSISSTSLVSKNRSSG